MRETSNTNTSETQQPMDTKSPNYLDGLGELVTRRDQETRAKYASEYRTESGTDGKGIVFVVGGRIALQATEDKIIVILDKYKSGYECSHCKGTGIGTVCPVCEDHPGLNGMGRMCRVCEGEPNRYVGKTCPTCGGKGSSLIIPDSAKSLPTSGVIVSIGPLCSKRAVGERIVFGAHVGFFLPFKGNVRLRLMRETEPLCLLHMVDVNATEVLGDFLQVDEQPDNS